MSENTALVEKINDVLDTIYDPEIPVNIRALGLVYGVEVKEGNNVKITMTLTAPNCPVAGHIVQEVQDKVMENVEGLNDVHVELTFDPPWDRSMMSEEALLELGFL